MFEVEKGLGNSVVSLVTELDVFSRVYDLIEQSTVPLNSTALANLASLKGASERELSVIMAKLFRLLPQNTNLMDLSEGWYGVKVLANKGAAINDIEIWVKQLKKDNLYMLERGKKDKDLTKLEATALLPSVVDSEKAELHQQYIIDRANEIMKTLLPINKMEVKAELRSEPELPKLVVSEHAGWRWAQRKLGIPNQEKARAHYKANSGDIDRAILASFSKAEVVWRGVDNTEFWFDDQNIMYVVGDHTIITLYEEEFGFSKSMNREIVYMQLDELRRAKKCLEQTEATVAGELADIDRSLDLVSEELRVLQATIEHLNSKKALLNTQKTECKERVRAELTKFNSEYNKLFRKWDPQDSRQ